MIIDGNPIEKAAMEQFHNGNREKGLRIQEEFASAFRIEYQNKDHCPCLKVWPLPRQLQRVCSNPPSTSRARSQLYAPYTQPENLFAL